MSVVLVDSNVLLDIFTEDHRWFAWSSAALERAANDSQLVVNPIIYGEISIRFERIEELDAALPAATFEREAIPYEGSLSRRQGLSFLPQTVRHLDIASAGLLHRRPRRHPWLSAPHTRCHAIPRLLSEAAVDRSDALAIGFTCKGIVITVPVALE